MSQADPESQAGEWREMEMVTAVMSSGLVVYAPGGKILRINPAAEPLLGLDSGAGDISVEDRLRGLGMLTLDGKPIAGDQCPTARAWRGETVEDEVLILEGPAPHGRRWVSMSAVPMRGADGQVERVVATFVKVTSLQQVQEQRDVLLRTVSHDLRTPLSVLLLHAQMLRRSLEPDDRNARRVDTIIANGQRLATMTQDLVEMIRLESGAIRVVRKPIEIPSFLKELVERMAATLAVDRVRVSCEPDLPRLAADPERLERVLVALLSNALKYSNAASEVLLHAARSYGTVTISVTDHGVGIARDDLARVFEPFYRTKDKNRQEGLGLGLTIAALVVRAHGGKIEVESEVGKGTVFRVMLPSEPGVAG
jgi:signal transduction histidine kinase